MHFRNTRLRTKITALLLSLVALWAFAAWVTLREGLNLLGVSTIDEQTTRPAVALVTALQEERRLSMIYLGRPGSQRLDLDQQRLQTDAAQNRFRELAGSSAVARVVAPALQSRIVQTLKQLDALGQNRRLIDSGQADRSSALRAYNEVIDAPFRVFNSANAGLD